MTLTQDELDYDYEDLNITAESDAAQLANQDSSGMEGMANFLSGINLFQWLQEKTALRFVSLKLSNNRFESNLEIYST